MSELDEIKARIDIIELIGESVQLRRAGKNYTGFCPFHPNTRTPAFYVFPDTGTWHCFSCNEGGDIFTFLMKKENLTFREALQTLAARAGITLKAYSEREKGEQEESLLHEVLEAATAFYHHQLYSTEGGRKALEYLKQRHLTDETIEKFELGFAPAGWEVLCQYLLKKGFAAKSLLEAGLVSEREDGGLYDRFRQRLMFPIRDGRGKITGFGARALSDDVLPKYLNSPQTALFDKSKVLYGLHAARKAIRMEGQVVIVEGYMDVIALHQHGFQNTISPMGTALTEQHLRLIKPLTKKIILALDPDAAGQKATLRGLEMARENLSETIDVVFDARGLVRKESRLQTELRVALLPQGLDPDEVVHKDPQLWREVIQKAKPIVDHVIDVLIAERNIDDAKEKAAIVQHVLPLIEDVPQPVEREAYRQHLARALHLDERALWGMQVKRKAPKSPKPEAEVVLANRGGQADREGYVLGVLLREPHLLYSLDRLLQENKLERLSQQDFRRVDYQEIFICLKKSVQQEVIEPYKFIQENLPQPLYDVLDHLYALTEKEDTKDVRLLYELYRAVLLLRKALILHQKESLDAELLEAQKEQAVERLTELQAVINDYLRYIAKFDKALSKIHSPTWLRT